MTITTPRIPIPIPIPANYTLTPPLRHRLNGALLASNAIPHLQAALLHEAQASGWLDAIRARVYELLRSGECTTYSEVMTVIMREVKGKRGGVVNGVGEGGVNGSRSANGVGNGVGLGLQGMVEENGVAKGVAVNGTEGRGGLVVPRRVVEEGVRIVRGVLEEVVEVMGEEGAQVEGT